MNIYLQHHQKQNVDLYKNIKVEYRHPADVNRVVSQTIFNSNLPCQFQQDHYGNPYQINTIIKCEPDDIKIEKEILLLNEQQQQQQQQDKLSSVFEQEEMHNIKSDTFHYSFGINSFPEKNNNECHHQNLVSSNSKSSDDSGIESDCTDGNLSWLLNYKIPELPPVPDSGAMDNLCSTDSITNKDDVNERPPIANVNEIVDEKSQTTTSNKTNSKNLTSQKPPFTYTELIEYALTENGALTVSGIYNWISQHFPFYDVEQDRWKNSVRHNLSINPQFRKGEKAVQGAGHFWTLAQINQIKTDEMRQRINSFLKITQPNIDHGIATRLVDDNAELQAATDSILDDIQDQYMTETGNSLLGACNDEIEIEFVNIPEGEIGLEDFLLSPVSKQDLANECGLGNDFFVTDINPNQLAQNFNEVEVTDGSIYDEMSSFEYYGLK